MTKKTLFLCFFFCVALPYASLAGAQVNTGALLGEAIEDINFQDFEIAEQKLTQVLKVEPENPYAKYYMASLLSQTKRPAAAVPLLESIKPSANLFPDFYTLLASVYLSADLPKKALPIYQQMYEDDMSDSERAFQYANALEQAGDIDLALAYYHLLTSKDTPYTDAAHFQIANVYMQLGANQTAYHELSHLKQSEAYGATAIAYQESLEGSFRPISIFLSGEYFYSDNPGAISSTYAKGAVPQVAAQGSAGQTLIASLSSMNWEISPHWQSKFAYTYFASFYTESFAKSSEFTGHFFTPSITYALSPQWQIEGKLDYQLLFLGPNKLSNNYGAGISVNYTTKDQVYNAHASLNYTLKRHNPAFGDAGATINMQYLDANSTALAAGGYLIYSDYNAVFSLDYNLLLENTLSQSNPILSEKAKDSEFREHTLSLNHHLPFAGDYEGLSFDISLSYSYRNYLNPQSGTSLPSIKPGNYFTAETTNAGVKIQYLVYPEYNINVALGVDSNQGKSQAVELSYAQTKYYGQISGSY